MDFCFNKDEPDLSARFSHGGFELASAFLQMLVNGRVTTIESNKANIVHGRTMTSSTGKRSI